MSQVRFAKLIESLCNSAGIIDSAAILHGTPLAIGEVFFSLSFNEKVNADSMLVYCDYGSLPAGREADALRELMSLNLYLYTGRGPCFSLSPTGHVLLVDNYPLDILDAEGLYQLMAYQAEQATQWRQTYFLDIATTSTEQSAPVLAHQESFHSLAGKL